MPLYGDRKREYDRLWHAARRENYFLEKWCANCGSIANLELDHIEPFTKLYNPKTLWGMSDSNPNKITELAKCQVLCEDCHKTKTIEEQSTRFCYNGHDKDAVGRDSNRACSECRRTRQNIAYAEGRR